MIGGKEFAVVPMVSVRRCLTMTRLPFVHCLYLVFLLRSRSDCGNTATDFSAPRAISFLRSCLSPRHMCDLCLSFRLSHPSVFLLVLEKASLQLVFFLIICHLLKGPRPVLQFLMLVRAMIYLFLCCLDPFCCALSKPA